MLVANLLLLATAALGAVVPYDNTQYDGTEYDGIQYDDAQFPPPPAAELFQLFNCHVPIFTVTSLQKCYPINADIQIKSIRVSSHPARKCRLYRNRYCKDEQPKSVGPGCHNIPPPPKYHSIMCS